MFSVSCWVTFGGPLFAKSLGVGERSLSKKDIVVEVEPVECSLSVSSLSLIDDVDEGKETLLVVVVQ